MKRTIVILLVCLFASAAFAFGSVPVSSKAPDFSLKDLHGKSISLSSYKGKTVLLDFFATWCPPCRKEIPNLVSIYKKLGMKNFEMIAINLREDSGKVSSFAKDNKIPFPVLLDNGDTANAYQVRYIPSIFILDKKGTIVFSSNYIPEDELEREIKKAAK